MRKSLKHLTYAMLIFVLLLAVPMAFAQEAAPASEATPDLPTGLWIGVFLFGCLAIIVVGGSSLARDRYNADKNEGS